MARVLVVDDDEPDRLNQAAILDGAGHDVYPVADGEEALRVYLETGIDLVVTNLDMQDIHGFELISIFQELLPTPPVIAVSSSGEFQLQLARDLGAVTSLPKPVDPAALERAVIEALNP